MYTCTCIVNHTHKKFLTHDVHNRMNCKFDGCPSAEMQQALQHKALVQNISRNRADLAPWHTTCSLLSDERAVARYRYVAVALATYRTYVGTYGRYGTCRNSYRT